MPDGWSHRRVLKRMRERAIRYAVNGWPVAPLAVAQSLDPQLAGEAVSTAYEVEKVWSERPWEIALMAQHFEVMELPPEHGALLNHRLKATCPTAMAPTHRRWWFFLEPNSIDAAQLTAAGGRLHRDWVPAPGTTLRPTGRIRWLVHPHQTRWQPYRRRDALDEILNS